MHRPLPTISVNWTEPNRLFKTSGSSFLSFYSKRQNNRFILSPPSKYWISLHGYKENLRGRGNTFILTVYFKSCLILLRMRFEFSPEINFWKREKRGKTELSFGAPKENVSCLIMVPQAVKRPIHSDSVKQDSCINIMPSTDLGYQLFFGRMDPVSCDCQAVHHIEEHQGRARCSKQWLTGDSVTLQALPQVRPGNRALYL